MADTAILSPRNNTQLPLRMRDVACLREGGPLLYVQPYFIAYRKVLYMARMKPTEDIQPLTAFRANVASFIAQVRETGRPLVLTQHGRGAAVLLGAAEYEALMDELDFLRDVRVSELQLEAGQGIAHEAVADELRALVRARVGD